MGIDCSKSPKVSVIIPTRNRSALLSKCLISLVNQSVNRNVYEVVVVDNGSTDNTKAIAEEFSDELNLQYCYEAEPGLHIGRHAGLRQSKSEVLSYIDDDVEVHPIWVESIIGAFTDVDVVMVGGNNIPMFVQSPPAWLKKMWDTPKRGKNQMISALSVLKKVEVHKHYFSPYSVWGCNFSIRKSTLMEAGGFHPDGMPKELIRFRGDGETHVSRYVEESGKKCLFHPGASVYHKVTPERMTVAYFRQRGFNQGVSDSFTALRAKHSQGNLPKANPGMLYRMVRWAYRKIKILRIRDAEIRLAMTEMAEGHTEGYAFHQQAFKINPEVRAWVLKENYL